MERTEARPATRYRETRYEAVIRLEQALERHHSVNDEPHELTRYNRVCACFCYVCACSCRIHSQLTTPKRLDEYNTKQKSVVKTAPKNKHANKHT